MALAYDHFVYLPKSIHNFVMADQQLKMGKGGEVNLNPE